jgi:putative membrane protein
MRTVDSRSAIVWSAAAVFVVLLLFFVSYDAGLHAHHMVMHIGLMNVAAPLLAVVIANRLDFSDLKARWLWIATAAQTAVLWLVHMPAVHEAAMMHHSLRLAVLAALTIAAAAFWLTCVGISSSSRWQTIPPLAISGKLFCLLAALLTFSPRPLYGAHVLGALEDQQLAGLLMIVACPLSYLLTALIISVQLISDTPTPRLRRVDP